jgi:hypothetical protein
MRKSRHSRRNVPPKRSYTVFAFGARNGVRITRTRRGFHEEPKCPYSRFIRTTRKDVATWVRSAMGRGARRSTSIVCTDWIAITRRVCYEFHNRKIIEHFAGAAGKLLVVCWENGGGWRERCGFLGKPEPENLPFPHLNASGS